MGVRSDGIPWPRVGIDKRTTYGGVSGNATRPMALRAISSIARALPNFPILGIGGVDAADVAYQFLQCGATVIQVCSAIQNQDFTLIEDYCTGLKALLYLDGRLPGWDGQSPPTTKHQLGKPVINVKNKNEKTLPHFGPYKKEREQMKARIKLNENGDLIKIDANGNGEILNIPQSKALKIKDVIGRSLPYIGTYKNMDNQKQVVALIDDVRRQKILKE